MLLRSLCVSLCMLLAAPAFADQAYLTVYEGDGSEETPFRAKGSAIGDQCRSLRADDTKVTGYAVCWGKVAPSIPEVIVLDPQKDVEFTSTQRAALSAQAGPMVGAKSANDVLSALVQRNQVSLRVKRGEQAIVVGGHKIWSRRAPLSAYVPLVYGAIVDFFSPAVAWAAATVTETFNAADQDSNPFTGDHTWNRPIGQSIEILSNEADVQLTTSTQEADNQTLLDDDDMSVQAVIVRVSRGSATNFGPVLQARASGGTSSTMVYCSVRDASTPIVEFGHKLSGSLTINGTASQTLTGGDVLKVLIVGDQLSCYYNGALVLGPTTDNTGAGNNRAGIRFVGSGTADASTRASLDNWVATNNLATAVRRRGGELY